MAGISKTTYSIPTIWEPDVEGVTYKQLGRGGTEVTCIKLMSGGGAAHVDLYDWVDNGLHTPPLNAKRWALDVATTGNDNNAFPSPCYYKNGLFAVLTEGTGTSPQLCTAAIPSGV